MFGSCLQRAHSPKKSSRGRGLRSLPRRILWPEGAPLLPVSIFDESLLQIDPCFGVFSRRDRQALTDVETVALDVCQNTPHQRPAALYQLLRRSTFESARLHAYRMYGRSMCQAPSQQNPVMAFIRSRCVCFPPDALWCWRDRPRREGI